MVKVRIINFQDGIEKRKQNNNQEKIIFQKQKLWK